MSIRYRLMRPSDVRECVEIVAAHPIVGLRYGSAIANLRPAWLRLIASEGFGAAAVFEETARSSVRILAVGASVFVSDDFLRELKTPPSFWIGPELAKRVAASAGSPVLCGKPVQQANTHGGLNLVVWQATVRSEDAQRIEVWYSLMEAFLEYHRGYLLKELAAQAESVEHLVGMRNTGGFLWNFEKGCYEDLPENLSDVIRSPHAIGMTRDMMLGVPSPFGSFGSWTGSLFLYEPPRFGFSRSEQRLLLSALEGGTDDELSDRLGLSLSMVKKTWRMTYARASACMPELIPDHSRADDSWPERGRGKKQLLLAYLRKHPEELRPVSRKLLQQKAVQANPGIRSF